MIMNQLELYFLIKKLNINGEFSTRKIAEIVFNNRKIEISDLRKINRYLNKLYKKGMIKKKVVKSNRVLYYPIL